MENRNLSSQDRENFGGTHSNTDGSNLSTSQLRRLFEDELKDIYWAENALTKAMPKMISNSLSTELRDAISSHLEETENQVRRLEQVFETLGSKATAQKCDAMEGLIKEAEAIMKECDEGTMRDEGIISAAQKVEHYEIATYGTLRQMAETLELDHAVELLQATLDEEKAADRKLTEIAVEIVNHHLIHAN